MRITVTIELDRDDAAETLTSLAGILGGAGGNAVVTEVPAEPKKQGRSKRKAEPAAEPAVETAQPTLTLVETPPAVTEQEEPAAFEAILAAQEEPGVDLEFTRNEIRNLMVDHLGILWARKHILPRYGSLSAVPDADLPGLFAQACADAVEKTEAETAEAVNA